MEYSGRPLRASPDRRFLTVSKSGFTARGYARLRLLKRWVAGATTTGTGGVGVPRRSLDIFWTSTPATWRRLFDPTVPLVCGDIALDHPILKCSQHQVPFMCQAEALGRIRVREAHG